MLGRTMQIVGYITTLSWFAGFGERGVRAQAVEQPQVQRTQRDAAVQHQKLLQKKQLQKEVRS